MIYVWEVISEPVKPLQFVTVGFYFNQELEPRTLRETLNRELHVPVFNYFSRFFNSFVQVLIRFMLMFVMYSSSQLFVRVLT